MFPNNLFYLLLLVLFDSFSPIPPTNSEFWLIKYIYDYSKYKYNTLKNFLYYYCLYVIFSLIGGLLAYLLGFLYKEKIINLINFIFDLLFGYKQSISDIVKRYDPLKVLLLKSFTPALPVSVFNIICGVYVNNVYKFIVVTLIFRSVRFCSFFLVKNYLQYQIIVNTLYNITYIYCIAIITLIIYSLFTIKCNNIIVCNIL